MLVMVGGQHLTDFVLIPYGERMAAFTVEALQEALQRAETIVPTHTPKPVNDDRPIWLTVPQVSRLCNVSETHLRDEIFVEHQTGHLDRIDGAGE
jgi:L-ascorbate metabolism protein UlaG (beta-lactamase superfamily)